MPVAWSNQVLAEHIVLNRSPVCNSNKLTWAGRSCPRHRPSTLKCADYVHVGVLTACFTRWCHNQLIWSSDSVVAHCVPHVFVDKYAEKTLHCRNCKMCSSSWRFLSPRPEHPNLSSLFPETSREQAEASELTWLLKEEVPRAPSKKGSPIGAEKIPPSISIAPMR